MKIHLDFDEELLIKRIKQGSPLLFGIALENDGIFYPAKNWIDFGVVIIGWWFQVAAKLSREQTRSQLRFMDGPYLIEVSYDGQKMTVAFEPDGLDVIWHTSIEEFRRELINAANVIANKFSQMNIDTESQITLKQAVILLESTVA
ncbi:MAG: hypothetical protein IAE79_00400 [Anaerolinea sp.]|nr:hypothetical protein [Anaerolinea sp.]